MTVWKPSTAPLAGVLPPSRLPVYDLDIIETIEYNSGKYGSHTRAERLRKERKHLQQDMERQLDPIEIGSFVLCKVVYVPTPGAAEVEGLFLAKVLGCVSGGLSSPDSVFDIWWHD